MIRKASESNADEVMLDLEDAVAPAEKVEARQHIIDGVAKFDWDGKLIAVRINDLDHQNAHGDLIAVVEGVGADIDTIIVPKVRRAADVYFVDKFLSQLEARFDLDRSIGIEVLIEETEAMQHVDEIAAASDRLEALIFGPGDYSAAQGVTLDGIGAETEDGGYPGDIWHYARNRIVVAARSNGVDAIDGPFGDFSDREGYRREARRARTLGFAGKWAIHPSQIPIANDEFSPTEAEVDYAQRVIAAMEEGIESGRGAVRLDGEMLDEASLRSARERLERARRIGMIE